MKPLNFFRFFLVFLFLSCQSDNLVYYVDGKVVASEQQKTTNQKSFSFDLARSKDFKVYVKELSELTTLNLKIKSDINLSSGDNIIIIDGEEFEFKNFSVVNDNTIEIYDSNILNRISSQLLKNKQFDLILQGDNLYNENQPSYEMTLDLKGTFLGVH